MLPLILAYRLRHYSPSARGWYLGYAAQDESWTREIRALAARLVEARPDLYSIVEEGRHREMSLAIAAGSKPSLAELAGELEASGLDRSVAQLEMVAAVLARGDMHGSYGNSYWANDEEGFHVLVCGPDWSKFRGVTSERWSEWGGTFAEDTYEDRLEVSLTCRCDEEIQTEFGLEPPSLAQLFVSLEAGMIERLFGV